jgi:hypothetical protein
MRYAARKRKLKTENSYSYSEGFIRASLNKCLKNNLLFKIKYKVVSK